MEYSLADAKRYARFLVRRACTDFSLSDSRFEVLNNGRQLETFALEQLLQDKILKQKENPFIFGAMLGENNCPFAAKMKEFLQLLAETHGETEKYDIQLGIYILLHGSKLSEIRPLRISKRLTNLIIDEDFVNYQKDTVCEDGTVLSGDSMPKAALKAIAGVKISGAVMDANPALGIADLASTIVLGNTQAGDLLTPSNNIKNAVNLLTDMASLSDRDYITAGIQSGKYGTMLKTYSEIPDFVADVSSNIGESLDVVTSDEFFDNLHDGIEDMYKDKDTGKIGVLTNLVVRPGLNIQHVAIEGARYGVKGVKWAGEMAGKAVSSAGELWDKAKNSLFNW